MKIIDLVILLLYLHFLRILGKRKLDLEFLSTKDFLGILFHLSTVYFTENVHNSILNSLFQYELACKIIDLYLYMTVIICVSSILL